MFDDTMFDTIVFYRMFLLRYYEIVVHFIHPFYEIASHICSTNHWIVIDYTLLDEKKSHFIGHFKFSI